MRVWIDADTCPRVAREQVTEYGLKRSFEIIWVASLPLRRPAHEFIRLMVVQSGAVVSYLSTHVESSDLVVCSDQTLAETLLGKRAVVLDARGREPGRGPFGGGPSGYSEQDAQAFSAAFERLLNRLIA